MREGRKIDPLMFEYRTHRPASQRLLKFGVIEPLHDFGFGEETGGNQNAVCGELATARRVEKRFEGSNIAGFDHTQDVAI